MKRSIAIAAVAASAVLAGGTALALTNDDPSTGETRGQSNHVQLTDRTDDTDRDDRTDDANDTNESDDTAARPTVTTSNLTITQAIDAALKARPGTVLSADLDTDDDAARGWEVEILTPDTKTYDIRIDPSTGKVLTSQLDRDTDPDDRRTPDGLTARQAAEAAAPKGTVTSVDFDEDHTGTWEIETHDAQGKHQDWDVNTKTGKITADRED
ncbi:hypothetical protein DF268_20135 [Streptomyces sp. V2]|uniref:PepSY domain-containing protein n=1 Tax=Streptomyces TaxID=1883 RepID=UPI0006EB604F|nr:MULTISPECIES: PepSY domain-containing protein [Streptomyces]PWG11688.1 hypothetical protein DF268_20135 [Streptomyces sp. V2]